MPSTSQFPALQSIYTVITCIFSIIDTKYILDPFSCGYKRHCASIQASHFSHARLLPQPYSLAVCLGFDDLHLHMRALEDINVNSDIFG